ncbi:MAG TPA: glycosyltransferase family 2 protein [Casimicrobiaceae bacterium]|jgi:glycosyltransferase involved in cell wall biosynthesis
MKDPNLRIAVVIPSYRVRDRIVDVIGGIGSEVCAVYVVDDACPDGTGAYVEERCGDGRVVVLRNERNQGVGAAVMRGYQAALAAGMDIIVKVDGDGQMDPRLIPAFVAPIAAGEADYVKGNRFFSLENLHGMPVTRLLGNAALSFMTKLSSGYWDLFDPTNGYTAIHAEVAKRLPFAKISQRYFFESDMLFRLNTLRAVVVDVPMEAKYGDEASHLRIHRVIAEFCVKHPRNFLKRLFYNYYLRDMSVASVEMPLGLAMLAFGVIFGIRHWVNSWRNGEVTSAGTVMLAAITVIIGIQFLLASLAYDIASVPRHPLHRKLQKLRGGDAA